MWRDLWLGGVFGLLLCGWRLQQQWHQGVDLQTQEELHQLQHTLAKTQRELERVSAQRTVLETQVAELNQLATDRAIELIQLRADNAELQAQVDTLGQKRTRKKRPTSSPAESSPVERSQPPEPVPFMLNLEAVEAKQREAIAATELLQTVFAEVPTPAAVAEGTGILDAAHAAFLATLGQQSLWSREDLRQVAQRLNLLLDGALELINETAFDRCEEALTDGEDPLTVNLNVLQELLS